MSFCDVILVISVEFVLARVILYHLVEENLAVNDRAVDIDDDVTVDDTTGVATTIDVTTVETTSLSASVLVVEPPDVTGSTGRPVVELMVFQINAE